MKEIESIRQFDEVFHKKTTYNRLIAKFVTTILLSIGGLLFLIPKGNGEDFAAFYGMMALPLIANVTWFTQDLMIWEDRKQVSIFHKLQYAPFDLRFLLRQRMGKVIRLVSLELVVATIFQVGASLVTHVFGIHTILYLGGVAICLYGAGVLQVYGAYRAGKHS